MRKGITLLLCTLLDLIEDVEEEIQELQRQIRKTA